MTFTIKNKNITATLTDYGATLMNLHVPDRNGNSVDVVLGYDSVGEYKSGNSCMGATVGRYANRIANGTFTLGGKTYTLSKNDPDFPNTLHGGKVGFHKRDWTAVQVTDSSVTFEYISPDEEEGFPGELNAKVKYSLSDCSLIIEYNAISDSDTIFNPTNHSYFNLSGTNDILDTKIGIFASSYTPVDSSKIPTGETVDVSGTVFDFCPPKSIRQDIESGKIDNFDHNYTISKIAECEIDSNSPFDADNGGVRV
ncbi:MAG: galactose mutarotase, partial [Oscillospiraceae bacterium]|nr:galactose mutarotase [Oscillospiraceae bacterium]